MTEENPIVPEKAKQQRPEHQLTDEEIAAIANKVVKSFKGKQYKAIAAHIAKSLTVRHYWIIGTSLGKSPLFWIVVIVAIASLCLTAWKAVPHFVKQKAQQVWNDEITNNIKSQFQEPRISNIVIAVANVQASNVMLAQIAPEISKFETNLTEKTQGVQSNLDNVLRDLYSRLHMQNETIEISDKSRVTRIPIDKGGEAILLRLSKAAIPSSVKLTLRAPMTMATFLPMGTISSTNNVAYLALGHNQLWILDRASFILDYAESSDKTQMVGGMDCTNGVIFFDGKPVILNW